MRNDKVLHHSSFIIRHSPQRAGFTLLEVVCVLAITSIVLATVFGILTTTVRTIQGTREILRENRVVSGIGRVLRRDFDSAYRAREQGVYTVAGGAPAGQEGGVSLAFFTTHSFLARGRRSAVALSRIEYILQPSERMPDRYEIVRKETPHALGGGASPGGPVAERLADGLTLWRVQFHDGVEWRDEWRRNKLPMVLRLDLAFGGAGDEVGETCTLFFSPLADPDVDPLPS